MQASLAATRVPIGGQGQAKPGIARDMLPLLRLWSQLSSLLSSCCYLVAISCGCGGGGGCVVVLCGMAVAGVAAAAAKGKKKKGGGLLFVGL